jgi:hypothetical protein
LTWDVIITMHARVLFLFGGLKLGLSAPLYVVLCVK